MATVCTDSSEPMRRVMGIPEFGPIVASSFEATLGDGQALKCGRVVSSWLGLTPHQYSTTGKPIQFGNQQAWQPLSAHHAGSRRSCSIEDG